MRRLLEGRIAGVLHVETEREIVLSHGNGEVFFAGGEGGGGVVDAQVFLGLEVAGHCLAGYAPAHEVEIAFAFESLFETHLGAESLAGVILSPTLFRIEADFIVGGIFRGRTTESAENMILTDLSSC